MRNLHSYEAESGVIGAMLIDPELIEDIGATLDRSHFFDADLGQIYALCLICKSKGGNPDLITLSDMQERLPSGESTLYVVGQIISNVPSAANGMVYAKVVTERYKARLLHDAGRRIQALATSQGSIAEQIAQAQALTMAIDAETDGRDVVQMHEYLSELLDDMQAVHEGGDTCVTSTGISDIDRLTGGYRKGTLNIIAGRPGSGKSLLANQVSRDAAITREGGALIFTLEMSGKELSKRQVAAIGKVPLDAIDSAKALEDTEQSGQLMSAMHKVKTSDIRVCDRANLKFDKLCAIARYQHRARPLSVIIVDYIGLIAGEDNKFQNRNLELGKFSRGLKQLAKELDIPVVALAQLNRGIEGRVDAIPKMSDLRDSGEIEQDADTIMICHRRDDELGKSGVTMAEVVKVRHGKVGGTAIQMQGEFARFAPLAHADQAYQSASQPKKYSKDDPFA